MKNDALSFCRIKFQGVRQVPGNRLPFAVFIAGQPDFGANGGLLELGDGFLFIGTDFIMRRKVVLEVNIKPFFRQVTNVAKATFNGVVFA